MSMRRDCDGLGVARLSGGGGVPGTFRTTQTVPFINTRDPEVQRRQASGVDVRNTTRYKGNMSEEQLLTFASTAVSRAAFNRTVLPSPALGRQLREETNGTILEYNRQIRTEVLRLSQADVAADYEHKALSHTFSQLLKIVEVPERMLWLGGVSKAKSSTRPTSDDPEYLTVLSAERALAKKWLARIQDRAQGTRNAMKTLGESRAVLANHLKTMKIGTDLMTDTYSGAVASFPAARFDDPPCLVRLAELYSASKERRLIDERDIEACSNELMEARNNMKVALDLALHQSKNLQRALILATGAARLARNKVARDDHEILIATGCNDGPAEGAAYLFTREKSDRPLVRKYNEVPQHAGKGITFREESRSDRNLFKSSKAMVKNDGDELDMAMRSMSATLHDRNQSLNLDGDIKRHRGRLSPGRRP
eukprot:m.58831 g.58831  ORF g.58831 m.58831 type:complete len:424 (-) comp17259_c0_seq1:191-1462(-)